MDIKDAVIWEVAGNDSFLAIIRAVEKYGYKKVLPTFSIVPEEEDYKKCLSELVIMKELLAHEYNCELLDYVSIDERNLWEANTSKKKEFIESEYGFYTPCIYCHSHVHFTRFKLAKESGINIIVTGERVFHGNKTKSNQSIGVLAFFDEIASKNNITFVRPLEWESSGESISKELEDFGFDMINIGLKCNKSKVFDTSKTTHHMIDTYLNSEVEPVIKRYLKKEGV